MAKQQGGGMGPVLLGVGVLGVLAYKFILKPGLLVPLATKAYVERMIVDIGKMKFTKKNIEFKLRIENPNNRPMLIKAIIGEVYMNYGTPKALKVGRVAHYAMDNIRAVNETTIDLIVHMNAGNTIVYILDTLAGKGNQEITFKGEVNANGRPWPIMEHAKLS